LLGEIFYDPHSYCAVAKELCLNRSANAKIIDEEDPALFADPSYDSEDGCSAMSDQATSETYYVVSCFIPATFKPVENKNYIAVITSSSAGCGVLLLESENGKEKEIVWKKRERVTPFSASSSFCK
jgi:hypothetical protein